MYPKDSFWQKYVEVLEYHLKSQFWKIMSQNIIQPIRITPRFCKLYTLVICVLYKSKSYKYNASLRNEMLYIDQNISQAFQPEFFRRMWIFFVKKPGYFTLNRNILKSPKKLDFRLFLYSLNQYPHQQKFFGVVLNHWMINALIFILLY